MNGASEVMTRTEALKEPNTEPLSNGRCVGQIYYDQGTCLRVLFCECPGGWHQWPRRQRSEGD